MAVLSKMVDPADFLARKPITFPIPTTAVGQADLKAGSSVPGFKFRITKVQAFCTARTAIISVDVKIGTTSALSAAITLDATLQTGTLSSTLSRLRGSSTAAINVHYTSDGAGAATNLSVTVWVRPYPMANEAALI